MDKFTSVVAALKAGKQPSQLQSNAWVEKLLQSELIQVENTAGAGELSQNGKKLARDLRGILEAYKDYSSHKNGMIISPSSLSTVVIPQQVKTLSRMLFGTSAKPTLPRLRST